MNPNLNKTKTLRISVVFSLELVTGLASLEPPAKQSTGLFFCLTANRQQKLLAPNSSPVLDKDKNTTDFRSVFFGAGDGT